MKKSVIVNVNLELEVEADSNEQAIELAQSAKLPNNYICGSFEIVKVLSFCGNCGREIDDGGIESDTINRCSRCL